MVELEAEESPSFRGASDLLVLPLISLVSLHPPRAFFLFIFFFFFKCENWSGQAEVCDLCVTTLDGASDVNPFDASCRGMLAAVSGCRSQRFGF